MLGRVEMQRLARILWQNGRQGRNLVKGYFNRRRTRPDRRGPMNRKSWHSSGAATTRNERSQTRSRTQHLRSAVVGSVGVLWRSSQLSIRSIWRVGRKYIVPLTCLSDFNPSNFTWCVVEGDGVDLWRRDLSWSFSENEEVPDFDFIVEAWLVILVWSRGVE